MAETIPQPNLFADALLLEQLAASARTLGVDPRLVQGGGGNVSAKSGPHMAVKASGVTLATCSPGDFATVSWAEMAGQLAALSWVQPAPSPKLLSDAESALLRLKPTPSIEVWLHALLGPVGIHLHPAPALAAACRMHWRELLFDALNHHYPDVPLLFVPYDTPGLPLAMLLRKEMAAAGIAPHPTKMIALLQNHGLLVAGPTAQWTHDLTLDVCLKLERAFAIPSIDSSTALNQDDSLCDTEFSAQLSTLAAPETRYRSWKSLTAARLTHRFGLLPQDGPRVFFPDQVVYCGPDLLQVAHSGATLASSWDFFMNRWKVEPVVALGPDGEVAVRVASAKLLKARLETLCLLQEVLEAPIAELSPLTFQQIRLLLGWDREAYRSSLLADTGRTS